MEKQLGMASLSENKAMITACEKNKIRAERLKYNLEKQGVRCVNVMLEDARKLDNFFAFDKILLDAPCSGSGTININDNNTTKNFTKELIDRSVKTQEELLNTVDQKIEVLKKESKEDDQRLNERLDNIEMESCKRFLIVEMTKLSEDKYRPNEEQKRILKETKKIYNDHGGDSYVDDMYEDLREKKVI